MQLAKTWLFKIESQYRIRLNKEIADHVRWLEASENFSINCIATIGPEKQLHVLPNWDETYFEQLKTSVEELRPRPREIAEPWVDLARDFATVWPVVCSYESKAKRFTMGLPKEARDFEIIPIELDSVIVFCTGDILEIWPSHKWFEHIIKIRTDLKRRIRFGLNSLEGRASS